ncbi:MAG: Rieske (2Fe-2S) protein [Thermoflexales bacterium]|nr:Rieske (2Fe-2S) protein [Thermoflexales bacterium]MCX7938956.1 Rieske (2Fe-2S) protein [Thermoflexales bacterium]MDW8054491.1 Rieske (2Fe-2S) protein [Anaerolineae bacterium]
MSRKVLLGNASEVPQGRLKAFDAEGISILVARIGDRFCAVQNKCPHLGLPMTTGKLEGNAVVCPWHGSRFDMCTGQNLDWVRGVLGLTLPDWSRRIIALGKQPSGVRTYSVFEEDGKLYAELP